MSGFKEQEGDRSGLEGHIESAILINGEDAKGQFRPYDRRSSD